MGCNCVRHRNAVVAFGLFDDRKLASKNSQAICFRLFPRNFQSVSMNVKDCKEKITYFTQNNELIVVLLIIIIPEALKASQNVQISQICSSGVRCCLDALNSDSYTLVFILYSFVFSSNPYVLGEVAAVLRWMVREQLKLSIATEMK